MVLALIAAAFLLVLLFERAILTWSPLAAGAIEAGGSAAPRPPVALHPASRRGVLARSAALLIAVTLIVAFARFDDLGQALRVSVVASALLICCATDLLSYRVPDVVTLPAIAFCLAWSFLAGEPSLASAALGAGLGGGFLLAAAVASRGGLGGGDVKLGVLAGAALGFPLSVFVVGGGIVAGSLTVICLYACGMTDRTQVVAFAPFLSLPVVGALLLA